MRVQVDVPGLRSIEGQVGSGKSAYAVYQIIELAKLGVTIFTNLQIRNPRVAQVFGQETADRIHYFRDAFPQNGEPYEKGGFCWCGTSHEGCIEKFVDLPINCEVFVDEAHHWFREGKAPAPLSDAIKRQRHKGVNIWLITPDAAALPAGVRRMVALSMTAVDQSTRPPLWGFVPFPAVRVIQHRISIKGKTQMVEKFDVPAQYLEVYDTTGGTVGNEPLVESRREIEGSMLRRGKGTAGFLAVVCGLLGIGAFSLLYLLPRARAHERARVLERQKARGVSVAIAPAGSSPEENGTDMAGEVTDIEVPTFYPCPDGDIVGQVEGFMVIQDEDGRQWIQMADGCHVLTQDMLFP